MQLLPSPTWEITKLLETHSKQLGDELIEHY